MRERSYGDKVNPRFGHRAYSGLVDVSAGFGLKPTIDEPDRLAHVGYRHVVEHDHINSTHPQYFLYFGQISRLDFYPELQVSGAKIIDCSEDGAFDASRHIDMIVF